MSSETLEVIGCLAAAGSLSASFLASDARIRIAGLVLAVGLATALIAGQGWDELRSLRSHHLEFAGVIVAAALVLSIGAAAMLRWPILLPLLVVATLPFRVRLHVSGGQAVNLLVPLYAVIGAGVLATIVATLRGETRLRRLPKPLVLALVLVVCLYALQTIYSEDVAFAARNVGFFLIPFAVLFSLMAEAHLNLAYAQFREGMIAGTPSGRRHFEATQFNELVQRFDAGLTFEVSELQAAERYATMMRELPGMEKALKSLGLDKRPALAASGVEFVLEGLHLSKRINKTELDGAAVYAG